MTTRIFIVERHAVFRRDLAQFIALLSDDYVIVGEVGMIADARSAIPGATPDIVLMDLDISNESGLDLVKCIRAMWPATHLLAISCEPGVEYRAAAFGAGADEYVDKLDLVRALPLALECLSTRTACPVPSTVPRGDWREWARPPAVVIAVNAHRARSAGTALGAVLLQPPRPINHFTRHRPPWLDD